MTARTMVSILALVGAFSGNALGQAFPNRPLTMVVASAAGSPMDLLARTVQPELTATLGQQIVIDLKPGASGKVGLTALLRAPRDGYTFATLTWTHLVTLPFTEKDLGFDVDKDFTLFTNGIGAPAGLAVHSSVPVKTLKEFVALAKQQGEKLNYGTFGTGSSVHFATEAMFARFGVKLTHVPYKSEALSMPDLATGRLQVMMVSGAVAPHLDSGAVRLIATTGESRWQRFPEVQTIKEQGFDYSWVPWLGFGAAAGIPEEARTRITAALVAALRSENVRQTFRKVGYDAIPSTPEAFAAVAKSDRAMVEATMKTGRIKLTD